MLAYFHPFYRYLDVSFPGGNHDRLFPANFEDSPDGQVANQWKFYAGADNLLVVRTAPAWTTSAGAYVLTAPVTASFTVRDSANRSEVFFSATTVARVLTAPAMAAFSTAPTAGSGPGGCILAVVTQAEIAPGEFEDVPTCSVFQLNATAGYTWPSPQPLHEFYSVPTDYSGYGQFVFNVRLENDAFVHAARQAMLSPQNASAPLLVLCQVTAVASGGITYYAKPFTVPVVLPVVRGPDFL